MQPLGQRVLIEDINEDLNKFTVILPPTVKEKPTLIGTVVAISTEIANPKIAVGDTIYRSEFIGQLIKVDGKQYRIMAYQDVLGKV